MGRPDQEPQPLKEILPGILRGLRRSGTGPIVKIRDLWPEIVGTAVAARCRVASLEGGVLAVVVGSAAVKHDLTTFRSEEILREVRRRVPEAAIRQIRYRVG